MKKTLITIAAIGMMIIAVVFAVKDMQSGEVTSMPGQKNGENIRTYFAIVMEAAEMKEALGEETPYCDIYKDYNIFVKIMGMRNSEALKTAESTWLQNRAVTWYAAEKGISADSEDVENYMTTVLEDMKESEGYETYSEMTKKLGITVEEFIRKDWKSYKNSCNVNNVYKYEEGKYKDEKDKPFADYWKVFVEDLVKQYKKTEDFGNIKGKLERSVEIVKDGEKLTAEELSKEDIYIE